MWCHTHTHACQTRAKQSQHDWDWMVYSSKHKSNRLVYLERFIVSKCLCCEWECELVKQKSYQNKHWIAMLLLFAKEKGKEEMHRLKDGRWI